MKKLALALMCLVSVAFFASCDPEIAGNPTINAHLEEGFVQNGDVVSFSDTVYFGFDMSYNIASGSKLSNLVVKVDDEVWDNIDLNGETEYVYTSAMVFNKKEMVDCVISAVVTDNAGNSATCTITFSIDGESAQELFARTFEWYRLGTTTTGLEEMGLYWEKNIKATHAQIKPLPGVSLFQFALNDSSIWDNTLTDLDKAALFSEAEDYIVSVYNNVATEGENDKIYNDVIGTLTADGTYHLILVEKMHWDAFVSQGYPFHITGYVK